MKNELALLRKENSLREKYLSEEEQQMIRRMLKYMTSKRIEVFDVEITHKELIGMALGAMKQGQTLKDIIGKDEKSFCDEVIANSRNVTWKDSFVRTLGRWVVFYGIIMIFQIILFDTSGDVGFGTRELVMMPLWALLWAALSNFISDNYVYEKGITKQIPTILFWVVTVIYIAVNSYFPKILFFELSRGIVAGGIIIGGILAKIIYDRHIHYLAKDYSWKD